FGAVAMVLAGRHSDRTGERRWHFAVAATVGGAALAVSTAATGIVWSIVTLSIAMIGLASMFGPFWALATTSRSALSNTAAAASIALVNSVGNTGGFVGPYLLGAINDATHSFAIGLYAIAAMMVAGAALVLTVDDR
ncbi:MAG: MFS transporter, partial [Acidobacteria bacterium]